jgi:hypothetical protein
VEKPKGLEEWEKRLVESADSKRKATVAQLCKFALVSREMMLTMYRLLGILLYVPLGLSICLQTLIISRSARIHIQPKEEARNIQGRHRRATGQLDCPCVSKVKLIPGIWPRICSRSPIVQWTRTCPTPKKTYKAPSRTIQDYRSSRSRRIWIRLSRSKD